VEVASGSIGIFIGCVVGMTPLLFIDKEKKKVQDMFNSIDTAGDGTVSVRELRTLLSRTGLHLSDDAFMKFFNAADLDADGVLSFDEFWALYQRATDIKL